MSLRSLIASGAAGLGSQLAALGSQLRAAPAAGPIAKAGGAGFPFDRVTSTGVIGGAKLARPYEQSAWVMRALQLKAGEIGAAPVKFYEGEREAADPALAAWWVRPFLGAGGRRLSLAEGLGIQAMQTDLSGEIFYVLGDDWLVPFPALRTLSPILIPRPEKMRHIVERGAIIGWEFTDGVGKRHALLPEQVIHRPLFNPYDDFRGLAPVKAIMNAAESDYLAGLYVRNLMRNNGDQGVYIIAKGGIPTDDQRDQIVAQLREKKRRALAGEFSAAFLTGDITVEDAKAQAPGADINAARLMSRHEIFIGLGVPASMADVKAAYSIGSASDRYQLITGTCQPLSRLVVEPLGDLASRQSGRVLTAAADWDDHPVVAEVRTERLKNADILWAKGMPMSAVNDYLGLGMKPFPGWEIAYLPFSVSPVGKFSAAPDPAADPALAELVDTASDPALASLRLALAARRRTRSAPVCRAPDPFAAFACQCHGVAGVEMRARDPKEIAQWKTLIAKRRATIASFKSSFTRVLMPARAEVLRKIEASYAPKEKSQPVQRAAATDFLFSLSEFTTAVRDALGKQQKNALQTAGQQLLAELDNDDPWSMPPAEVTQYLAARENRLRDVPQNVFDRIKASLSAGLDAGDTTAELTSRVKAEFNTIADGEARRIAMTETAAAYGAGRDSAMKSAGVQWKQWLTSGNDNVRPYHAEANGQTVTIDEPFIVGGEELMHPGDDTGSAANVINCHCISIAVAQGPDNAA